MSYSKLKQGESVPFSETLSIQLIQQKDLLDIFKMLADETLTSTCSLHRQTKAYTTAFLVLSLRTLKQHLKSNSGQTIQHLSLEIIRASTWE